MMISNWFENDIFINIYARFIAYALSGPFLPIFVSLMFFLGCLVYLLRHDFKDKYDFLFLPQAGIVSKQGIKARVIFITAVMIYAGFVIAFDNGIFSNCDLMFDHFITGTRQQYNFLHRLNPLVFLDLTFLFGITHNFTIITVYTILLNLILMYLLYRLFDNIAPDRRLIILAVVMLMPSYLLAHQINFTEKIMLIYITAGFLCLKNWFRSKKVSWIFFFLFWMNVACYTKETNLVLYFGIFVMFCLRALWSEKLTLASFIHPVRSIKNMPLEFLIGLSILVFAVQYVFIIHDVIHNTYLQNGRYGTLTEVFLLYWFEIFIVILSLLGLRNCNKNTGFVNVLYFASLLAIGYICLYLRMLSFGYTSGRTYYLAIPVLYLTICWLGQIKSSKILYGTAGCLVAVSCVLNYQFYKRDIGKSNYELAAYFAQKDNVTITLGENSRKSPWYCMRWPRAFKQAHKMKNIIFRQSGCITSAPETILNYRLDNGDTINVGDYYVVVKFKEFRPNDSYAEDIYKLAPYEKEKVLENKYYLVYQITGKK